MEKYLKVPIYLECQYDAYLVASAMNDWIDQLKRHADENPYVSIDDVYNRLEALTMVNENTLPRKYIDAVRGWLLNEIRFYIAYDKDHRGYYISLGGKIIYWI